MIHAFQAYDTVIKADPLVVMKQLTQLKAQQNSEQPTRRDESKKLPALKQARSTDTRTKMTAQRQVSPASLLVTPLFSTKQSPISRNVKAPFATTGTDRLENKPLRQAVRSERELEQLDQSRHNDYKLYWHFQEFNPVDLKEDLDIDEKFKMRKKMDQVINKLRSLPETVHINKFLKYEKLNLRTQMYNKTSKVEAILKQLNADPAIQVQKEIDMMGGAPGSELAAEQESKQRVVIYAPKMQLVKELSVA